MRLHAGRRIIELQNELITAREALRAKATHNPLTGLWNHEEILRILGRELARADREDTSVALLMTDLDHFKKVNDTYGHLAGDIVLRVIAKRMLALIRMYDAVGRYGGEKFLVVLPGCDHTSSLAIAERFRLSISKDNVDTSEGMIPVAISIRTSVTGQGKTAAADALIRAADAALYRAKSNGRNRVEGAPE